MTANVDLDIGRKTFASGLLPELIAVLRRSQPGDLIAVVGDEKSIGPELIHCLKLDRMVAFWQKALHYKPQGTCQR